MFFTIGSAIAGIFGKKVTAGIGKGIGIAALTLGALLAVLLFFHFHDKKVIDNADNKRNAAIANGVVTADRYAGDQKAETDAAFANSQAGVGAAVNGAVVAHPVEVKKPVGPASQAYYDELRKQKGKK